MMSPGFTVPLKVRGAAKEIWAGALDNVRERLAACGATLDISSREGGGTKAVIRMPPR